MGMAFTIAVRKPVTVIRIKMIPDRNTAADQPARKAHRTADGISEESVQAIPEAKAKG